MSSLISTFLYKTGNLTYHYIQGWDAQVPFVASGENHNVYRINYSNDIQIIHDNNNFGWIDNNTVYTKNNSIFNLSGRSLNDSSVITTTLTGYYQNILVKYGTTGDMNYGFNIVCYPDAFNASQHLLIVYNANNPDSLNITNYYLSIRTGLAGANTLGVSPTTCSGSYNVLYSDYSANIKKPIIEWISGSNKPIRYVALMYDLPMRCTGDNYNARTGMSIVNDLRFVDNYENIENYNPVSTINSFTLPNTSIPNDVFNPKFPENIMAKRFNTGFSLSLNLEYHRLGGDGNIDHFSLTKYLRTSFLTTHVTARNKQDISGYITKLGQARVSGHYLLSSTGNNKLFLFKNRGFTLGSHSGTLEWLSDVDAGWAMVSGLPGIQSIHTLIGTGIFGDWPRSSPRLTGSNLAAFAFHGNHSVYGDGTFPFGGGTYAQNGTIRFSGENWYIMTVAESFFGDNYDETSNQGYIFKCLQSGAFGGFAYENCPIGVVGTIDEPFTAGIAADPYFRMWASGYPFIECSNCNMNHQTFMTAVGDPFVRYQ